MIEHLASPSVCVVDDEPEDFEAILDALNLLHVSAVHIKGDLDSLPANPFTRLRLVFLDLHLVGTIGKDAASHAAHAFTKIVSSETAPVVVVIWSKYAGDQADPDSDETEAQLFKRTLIGYEPKYEGRLIFVEMMKPKQEDRPNEWTAKLKAEIKNTLEGQPAIEALWAWDSMVQEGCTKVSAELTNVAKAAVPATVRSLSDGLKNAMQSLVQAQGEGDITKDTAPTHFTNVFSQLLSDRLEYPDNGAFIASHGKWLSEPPATPLGADFSSLMNGFLMASDLGKTKALYVPGTVYSVADNKAFKKAFGVELSTLMTICYNGKPPKQDEPPKEKNALKQYKDQKKKWEKWTASVRPIGVEISPACDVAQGKRICALLVAGLLVPKNVDKDRKRAEFISATPSFRVHWPADEWKPQDVTLLLCHSYRITVPSKSRRQWLIPWFRLRELPSSAIRNANAAHASRVGYVSVK